MFHQVIQNCNPTQPACIFTTSYEGLTQSYGKTTLNKELANRAVHHILET